MTIRLSSTIQSPPASASAARTSPRRSIAPLIRINAKTSTNAAATLDAADTAPAGALLDVAWTGPGGANDYISSVAPDGGDEAVSIESWTQLKRFVLFSLWQWRLK